MPPSYLRFSSASTIRSLGRPPCPSYHSYMDEEDLVLEQPGTENPDEADAPPNYRPPSMLPPPFSPMDPPVRSPLPQTPVSPGDTTQTMRTPHHFSQNSANNQKKIVFSLLSRASSPKHQPSFLEGDNIEGNVIMNLDREEYIQAIKVTVQGKLLTGSGAQTHVLTFVDFSHTVWDRLHPHPGHAHGGASSSMNDGKLTSGEYTFPFCFPFPSGANITLPGCHALHLPHTFLERDLNGNVQYEIVLRIVKGKFRTDIKIRTMVAHIPRIGANPIPPLRRQAYLTNTPLLSPSDSQDEWHTLEHATIRGKVFNSRPAEVQCIFSLSHPLSYTRGTVIPCHLTITSLDSQALDLLASSESIDVRLRREMKFYLNARTSGNKKVAMQTSVLDVEMAVWKALPCSGRGSWGDVRKFEGEIHLSKDLQPSSDFSLMTIEYTVVLLPFIATGFSPDSETRPLAQPVRIVTDHASGPRPIRYLASVDNTGRLRKNSAQQGVSDEVDLMSNIGSFSGSFM